MLTFTSILTGAFWNLRKNCVRENERAAVWWYVRKCSSLCDKSDQVTVFKVKISMDMQASVD